MRVSVWSSDVCSSDLLTAIRRHASAVVAPCARATSASRSLPIISSGRCFLLGIHNLLRNPKYHQFWTTQKEADQRLDCALVVERLRRPDRLPDHLAR